MSQRYRMAVARQRAMAGNLRWESHPLRQSPPPASRLEPTWMNAVRGRFLTRASDLRHLGSLRPNGEFQPLVTLSEPGPDRRSRSLAARCRRLRALGWGWRRAVWP